VELVSFKLLIVEDEERVREVIGDYFKSKDFVVYEAFDGIQALEQYDKNDIDIVLLDIMMPGLDGFTVCSRIRKKSDIPIIFITARGNEDDKLLGYDLGADDYITKPFSLAVMYAKVMSIIKRSKGDLVLNQLASFSGIDVNYKIRQVLVDGKEVYLAPKEYELMICLIENRDRIMSREQLLSKVWGYDYYGDDRVVDTHIKKLRSSLGCRANCIRTIIKVGYKFEEL